MSVQSTVERMEIVSTGYQDIKKTFKKVKLKRSPMKKKVNSLLDVLILQCNIIREGLPKLQKQVQAREETIMALGEKLSEFSEKKSKPFYVTDRDQPELVRCDEMHDWSRRQTELHANQILEEMARLTADHLNVSKEEKHKYFNELASEMIQNRNSRLEVLCQDNSDDASDSEDNWSVEKRSPEANAEKRAKARFAEIENEHLLKIPRSQDDVESLDGRTSRSDSGASTFSSRQVSDNENENDDDHDGKNHVYESESDTEQEIFEAVLTEDENISFAHTKKVLVREESVGKVTTAAFDEKAFQALEHEISEMMESGPTLGESVSLYKAVEEAENQEKQLLENMRDLFKDMEDTEFLGFDVPMTPIKKTNFRSVKAFRASASDFQLHAPRHRSKTFTRG